jgi:hypothetical protein
VTADASQNAPGLPPGPPTISDEEFGDLIASRSREALRVASYIVFRASDRPTFTRPMLGEILHQATELEELLDAYGARNSRRWSPFRSTVAAAKLFADVLYVLLHIEHSLPAYRLLEVEGNFAADTAEVIVFTGQVMLNICRRLLSQAGGLGMAPPSCVACEGLYQEDLPPGRLAHDRAVHRDLGAAETVTRLATAFLNQAAESELLHVPNRVDPSHYADCVPSQVSEEQLRRLQHRFHNLQSTYDTFVADTDVERQNTDLPVLRGHVSVIFHLLETAIGYGHYYERHVMRLGSPVPGAAEPLLDGQRLLNVLMRYSLVYASRYLIVARGLCQGMLRRYAEVGRVEVPGPRYRGFHVRPSTLVAKIVHHYGNQVMMELDGATFDASSPMDIFRANEKINREKRSWLTAQLSSLAGLRDPAFLADLPRAVRQAVMTLAEQGRIVIYQRVLPIQPPDECDEGRTAMQYILDEVNRLQSIGVIDIEAEIRVAFVGDKRVLGDLKLLAESGYGEDNFGNNVPLPKELSYLRRGPGDREA